MARKRDLTLLLLLALVVPGAPARAGGAPRCDGKRATIVSNAPRIVGTKAPDVIVAGRGRNTIDGRGGNDLICAGGGNDVIHGERGSDTIFGEGGRDRVLGERGSDRLDGGAGRDRLVGGSGNDRLEGGAGSGDRLDGGPGDDRLNGGPGGFDVLIGGPGRDRLDGGPGPHDIASYQGTGGELTIDLEKHRVFGAEQERLPGIEDAVGGSGDDTLAGDAAANRLDGGPGEDRLFAAGPGDEAFGGPGSDRCEGGFSATTSCGPSPSVGGTAVNLYRSIDGSTSLTISGNPGSDRVVVGYRRGTYGVSAEPGGNAVTVGPGGTGGCSRDGSRSVACPGPISRIEAALGPGDDELSVAHAVPARVAAAVDGGSGSDTLRGGRGDDVLYGGDDHAPDVLIGRGGDDVLFGVNIFHPRKDSGAARMLGGPGNDLLVGGQPCDGDTFNGGPGGNDSASFARVRNSGVFVKARIGGPVRNPGVSHCDAGHIYRSVEKIEGSPGPDVLIGDNRSNTLFGRGGNDRLNGRSGDNRCIGGPGHNHLSNCRFTTWNGHF